MTPLKITISKLKDSKKRIGVQKFQESKIARFIVSNNTKAGKSALKAGHSVTILRGNKIVELNPKGHIFEISSVIESETFVKAGSKSFKLK